MHNNKPVNQPVSNGRRQFLRGVAVVSAAGIAASAGSAIADTEVPEVQTSDANQQGYHETDHIRSYYASCR